MKKTTIIAEIAQLHDGSLGIAHSLIDAISKTGIDIIKFQTHIAEAESSNKEQFRVNFSYEDKSRYDYWKRMEFSPEQWTGLKKHVEDVGCEFLSSPFSIAAVELLERINVKRYKIASGEFENFLMLSKIAETKKQILLSSGLSSLNDIEKTIEYIKKYHNNIVLLQCTTKYPTMPEDVGLNMIHVLKSTFKLPVGLSDHSGKIYPSIGAVTLGAEYIEIHATFDKMMFGPDSTSSLTIKEIKKLVEGIRFIDASLNNPVFKKQENNEVGQLKRLFGKSLALNKKLNKGSLVSFCDLESKKPYGVGIPASEFKRILNKKLNKDVDKYSFLNYTDFDD